MYCGLLCAEYINDFDIVASERESGELVGVVLNEVLEMVSMSAIRDALCLMGDCHLGTHTRTQANIRPENAIFQKLSDK